MDTVTHHTNYIVIAPDKPTDKALVKKISQAMADIEDIQEAHLPAVIAIGSASTPALVLFVVVDENSDGDNLLALLKSKINGGLFRKTEIEIKIVPPNFHLLPSIRNTQCLIGWRD